MHRIVVITGEGCLLSPPLVIRVTGYLLVISMMDVVWAVVMVETMAVMDVTMVGVMDGKMVDNLVV